MVNPIAATFLTASVVDNVRKNYNCDDVLLRAIKELPKERPLQKTALQEDICRVDGDKLSDKCLRILNSRPRKKRWNFWKTI